MDINEFINEFLADDLASRPASEDDDAEVDTSPGDDHEYRAYMYARGGSAW